MQIEKAKDGDLIGETLKSLYEMLADPTLKISPGENGGIWFETEFNAVEVDQEDGLYCTHKTTEQESQDYPGPTPDHPDTTRYYTWCDCCKEEIEPEEPEDERE